MNNRFTTIGFIDEYATCKMCGYKDCYNGYKPLERETKCPKCGGELIPDWIKNILDYMPELKRESNEHD